MQRTIAILWLLIVGNCCEFATCHPDVHEDELVVHFATGLHGPQGGVWLDGQHHVVGQLVGSPQLVTIGPAKALRLDGLGDYVHLADSVKESTATLPRKEISISAWVLVEGTAAWSGICGVLQDDGGNERGWILGMQDGAFMFGLSTEGADDGDGRLTYLSADDTVELGRWHLVTAVYDGEVIRLYVNGKLAGESREQHGKILYPQSSPWVMGGYIDSNEEYLFRGAIYEVKVYARAITPEEITLAVSQNQSLIAYVPPAVPQLSFLVRPYLQFGTRDSMTIMCETNQPTRMQVRYGKRQPLVQSAETHELGQISTITLDGLDPQTIYYYVVRCWDEQGNEVIGDVASFATAPDPHTPWSFAIIGDTQRNPDVTRRCAEGAFSQRPNFLLHCGDVVDDGFAKHQWLQDLFEPCANLMAHVPTFPVIGNHEQDSHWYYDYFHLPEPEYYYTFTYGNAQFFMIDSNKDLGADSEQYRWLEEQLAACRKPWKFTCHHHPCFSSDEDDYGNRVTGAGHGSFSWGDPNAQQLITLYEKYGVDIAFNGHIHVYERTWPIFQMMVNQRKGVRYITSGGGGGNLETPAPHKAWFSVQVKKAFHYCYVAVHDQTMEFRAYDIDDRMLDTFQLNKVPDAELAERTTP